jgi:hypothetical protein
MAIQADVVRAYLDQHPDLPSRQVARILHATQGAVFPTFDSAYGAVRNVRGAHGKRMRASVNVTHPQDPGLVDLYEKWSGLLPPADPSDWFEIDLPAGPRLWGLAADYHFPYHHEPSIATMMAYFERREIDGLLIDGDLYDSHHLSFYERDPRKRRFTTELDTVKRYLDALRAAMPHLKVVWKEGNHDDRYTRYLNKRAPEIAELASKDVDRYLEVEERGILKVPSMGAIRCGKLTIIHGHELRGGRYDPVNPARTAFMKTLDCMVVADAHRSNMHTGVASFSGTTITCWSLGCLCNRRPHYRPINEWNWGFGLLHTPPDGSWRIENLRIVNGEVA